MLPIPTALLRISHLPGQDAGWEAISEFALTFDGHEWAGGITVMKELASEIFAAVHSGKLNEPFAAATGHVKASLVRSNEFVRRLFQC